jgi:hypothetical protein
VTAPAVDPAPNPDALPLGIAVQIAYLVEDVLPAAEEWARRLGAGPFFVRHHPPMACVDRQDRAGEFVHSSAYGQWGAMQVELVQLRPGTPRHLVDDLRTPRGIHHVAMFVASFPEEQDRLAQLGWPAAMTATTSNGMRFAFHDARADLGHFVEIYEPVPAVRRLYATVAKAAHEWTGEDPVRQI